MKTTERHCQALKDRTNIFVETTFLIQIHEDITTLLFKLYLSMLLLFDFPWHFKNYKSHMHQVPHASQEETFSIETLDQ